MPSETDNWALPPAHYELVGTSSGRLSSRGPNLSSLPQPATFLCETEISLDKVNKNGRLYPRQTMERAIEAWKHKKKTQGSTLTVEHPTPGSKILGFVTDAKIRRDKVVFEIRTLSESLEGVNVSMNGHGVVAQDGTVSDYSLEFLTIVPKPKAENSPIVMEVKAGSPVRPFEEI